MTPLSITASVLEVVSDGNRVQVIGRRDVWVKVKLDNQTGYVKQNNLQMVEL